MGNRPMTQAEYRAWQAEKRRIHRERSAAEHKLAKQALSEPRDDSGRPLGMYDYRDLSDADKRRHDAYYGSGADPAPEETLAAEYDPHGYVRLFWLIWGVVALFTFVAGCVAGAVLF